MTMKPAQLIIYLAAALAPLALHAQNPADAPIIEPVPKPETAEAPTPAPPAAEAPQPNAPVLVTPAVSEPSATEPAEAPVVVEPTGNPAITPTGDGKAQPDGITVDGVDPNAENPEAAEDDGFIIKDAGLNDIFQFLAKSAGKQYFHNSQIAGPEFLVTGHLNDGDPLQQMEELAFMYGLSLHTKGDTIYALTKSQLTQLPSSEFHYQLRYLRPTDIESIKDLIRPMLSPGTGIVNFEPKTNTVVIIDSAHRIEQARNLLHNIDQAKGQIIVETKILRVNSSAAESQGINWSNSLGSNGGVSLTMTRTLNSIFGISPTATDASAGLGTDGSSANLVLSPYQVTGVLRALNEGNLASQVSNPTLITEDNEQASISIIDRIPIITTTTTPSTTGPPTITEEVRYKIDSGDKSIDADPNAHREIGISIVVTPTLLPDGTVRMKMRPRSAQIVDSVRSVTGNTYPRVTESMVESLARVPNGYSLVVGGFYGETNTNDKTKIPILGDIPVINFFFKSKDTSKEKTSLVFIVTPTSYNPRMGSENDRVSNEVRKNTSLGKDHDWADPNNPGPGHEPNMLRTLRGLVPEQAPYYPKAEMVQPNVETSSSPAKPRFGRGKR